MTLNVYLAGSSGEIERARTWSARLADAGISVVSSWVRNIAEVGSANPRDATSAQRRHWSSVCLGEVRAADVVWFLVPSTSAPTRGAWVEVGFADAVDRARIVCSGDTRQSIFCALADEFDRDEDAFEYVCRFAGNARSVDRAPVDLDELLELARFVRDDEAFGCERIRLGAAVIDALGVGFPCGFAEPHVADGHVRIAFDNIGEDDGLDVIMNREEALGMAAAIVRRALELPEDK